MYFRLDNQSGEAFYRQIVEQVKYRIAAGQLQPGQKLPSIRELAAELSINTRTVVKAYEQLRAEGLAVMQQGQGVFVTENQAVSPAGLRQAQIEEMAKRIFSEGRRIGASKEEIMHIIKQVEDGIQEKSNE